MQNRKTLLLSFVGLIGFAVAAPLYDVFGKAPEFFVIRRLFLLEIALFALGLSFGLPLILSILIQVLGVLSQRAGEVAFGALFLLLSSILFLSMLVPSWPNAPVMVCLVSILGSGTLGLLLLYNAQVKRLTLFLAYAGFIFPAVFLYQLVAAGTFSSVVPGEGIVTERAKAIPTVLVVFDEFPLVTLLNKNLDIDEKRFPAFHELRQSSTWFRNGTTVTSWTERAVPVILSGMLPDEQVRQIPSIKDYPQNIFTLLSATHEVKSFEQVTNLCPESICKTSKPIEPIFQRMKILVEDAVVVFLHRILPQDYKKSLPEISFQWGAFLEHDTPKKKKKGKKGLVNKGDWSDDVWLFKEFIKSMRESREEEKPPFFFLHVTFPHVPYRYLPSGQKYIRNMDKRNDRGFKRRWEESDKWFATQAMQRLLLQGGYADRLLGEMLAALKQKKLFDQSMIVVVADHGSSFQPGEFARIIGEKNTSDIMKIPFFVKLPFQERGEITDSNVQTIDVVPTILMANQIGASKKLDGMPVFEKPRSSEKVFFPFDNSRPRVTLSPSLGFEPTLTQMIDTFGDQGFSDRFYQIGPGGGELIGRKATEMSTRLNIDAGLQLDEAGQYRSIKKQGEFLPAYITGKCSKELLKKNDQFVVIVVNGTIGATTIPFLGKNDECAFTGMVSDKLFKDGANTVEVFLSRR